MRKLKIPILILFSLFLSGLLIVVLVRFFSLFTSTIFIQNDNFDINSLKFIQSEVYNDDCIYSFLTESINSERNISSSEQIYHKLLLKNPKMNILLSAVSDSTINKSNSATIKFIGISNGKDSILSREFVLNKKLSDSSSNLYHHSLYLPNQNEYAVFGNFTSEIDGVTFTDYLHFDSTFNLKNSYLNGIENLNSSIYKLLLEDIFSKMESHILRQQKIDTVMSYIDLPIVIKNTKRYYLIFGDKSENFGSHLIKINKENFEIDTSFSLKRWNNPNATTSLSGITEYFDDQFLLFGNLYESYTNENKNKANLMMTDANGNILSDYKFELFDKEANTFNNVLECFGLNYEAGQYNNAIIEDAYIDNEDTIYIEYNPFFAGVPHYSRFVKANILKDKLHVVLFDLILILIIILLLRKFYHIIIET